MLLRVDIQAGIALRAQTVRLSKFGIDERSLQGILFKSLDRFYDMNITRATLFPGLDGFAQSLKVSLPKRWDLRNSILNRAKL